MKETEYQSGFLSQAPVWFPTSIFAPHLALRYEIGKYHVGKTLGMPDCVVDVIEFDIDENFALWEFKLLEASDLWNGKFFGQLMLYHFLFTTEPWNELLGRFAECAATRSDFVGDIGAILGHLMVYGDGEEATPEDPNARLTQWNLVVCGGKGFELAAGVNPAIWSFGQISEEYLVNLPPLRAWHLFQTSDSWQLYPVNTMSIYKPNSLHPESWAAWQAFEAEA